MTLLFFWYVLGWVSVGFIALSFERVTLSDLIICFLAAPGSFLTFGAGWLGMRFSSSPTLWKKP